MAWPMLQQCSEQLGHLCKHELQMASLNKMETISCMHTVNLFEILVRGSQGSQAMPLIGTKCLHCRPTFNLLRALRDMFISCWWYVNSGPNTIPSPPPPPPFQLGQVLFKEFRAWVVRAQLGPGPIHSFSIQWLCFLQFALILQQTGQVIDGCKR